MSDGDWHHCSYCFHVLFIYLFLGPWFSLLSFILWNPLWLVEEVLTLLCIFLIMQMEISWFLWEIFSPVIGCNRWFFKRAQLCPSSQFLTVVLTNHFLKCNPFLRFCIIIQLPQDLYMAHYSWSWNQKSLRTSSITMVDTDWMGQKSQLFVIYRIT
jgi:hypothetical protein